MIFFLYLSYEAAEHNNLRENSMLCVSVRNTGEYHLVVLFQRCFRKSFLPILHLLPWVFRLFFFSSGFPLISNLENLYVQSSGDNFFLCFIKHR